ncbi:MAG: HlyD family secretion protein [Pseudomonadales bacterium]
MNETRATILTPTNLIAITILLASSSWLAWWFYDRSQYVFVTDARISATMINISSRIPGWVMEFPLDEGQQVVPGQLLVRIDDRDTRLKLAEVEANIETLRSERERQQLALVLAEKQVASSIASAESSLVAARAGLSESIVERVRAGKDFTRATSLLGRNMISEEIYEEKEATFNKAVEAFNRNEAEVAAAEARLMTEQAGRSRLDVLQKNIEIAEGKIREMNVERMRLNNLLEDHEITSPIRGVVDETFINSGEHVYPGQRILMLHNPDKIWVKANIKETEIRNLRIGSPVEVSVDAYPGRPFVGVITNIGTSATSQFAMLPSPNPSGNFTKVTQRLEVKVELKEPNPDLKPGMMVELRIPVAP